MGVEDYNKRQLDRLRNHKIAFDQEAMWAAMQKKKKRRGAFFFITMALVALAIVFLTWSIISSDTYEIDNPKLSGVTESDNTYQSISDQTADVNNETTDLSISDASTLVTNDDEDDGAAKELSKATSKKAKQSRSAQSNTLQSVSQARDTQVKQNTGENDNESKESKVIQSIPSQENMRERIDTNGKLDGDKNISSPENVELRENEAANKTEIASESADGTEDLDKRIDIRKLELHEFPFLESLKKENVDIHLEMISPPMVEVTANKSRFSIGAYGGVGYLFRMVTLNTEPESMDAESLEEFSAGLELKYQLKPNIYLRSGVEYWQATDRNVSTTTEINNILDIANPESLGIAAGENGIIVQTTFSKKYFKYQSYNIPLVVGWNTNNDKWNAFAEAGVLYNFKNTAQGELPLQDREGYAIGSRNQISPIVGMGVAFSPTKKIEIYTRVGYRASQSVNNDDSPYDHSYASMRGQVGVRIGF